LPAGAARAFAALYLAKGDQVHLIGKTTTPAKQCNQSAFTAATTIRRIVFHGPAGTAEGNKA
jgi:hypothetical protein